MKTLALFAAIWTLSAAQSASSVAGAWTAQFDGRTFIRLELKNANGKLEGGISLGNFELDKTGAVRKASDAPPGLLRISDVQERDSTVFFTLGSSDEPDRFRLRLLDARRAELRMLISEEDLAELAAEGIPAPLPIALTRQ